MKKIILGLVAIILLVILAGIFKFNIFSNVENYDVNENKISSKKEVYVIETEVESSEDCVELEKYDAERGVCFIECDTPAQCDEMEAKLDAALDALEGEYKEFSKDFKEFEGDSQVLEDNAEVVYIIEPGENFVVSSGDENDQHIKIKKWLAVISPNDFSDTYIHRLIPYTKSNDGAAAYVTQSSLPGKWDMYVSMETFQDGDQEMIFTLIHEFTHILTLNNAQLDEAINKDSCKQYFVVEGCLNADAYLNVFYNKYWKGKYDPKAKDSHDIYDKNPSAFVTEYAATNPEEDIAESFPSFVFNKEGEIQSTIAKEKTAFFHSYSELKEIRDSVRSELKSFVRKRVVSDVR